MTAAVSTSQSADPDQDAPGDDLGPSEIARLEARIEHLSARAERCRKVMRISRLAVAAGAVALVALVLGLIRFDSAVFVAALAAVLGGFPLAGSTKSTLEETLAALRATEERRAALIDGLGLQTV
jgi:hypothetical protein